MTDSGDEDEDGGGSFSIDLIVHPSYCEACVAEELYAALGAAVGDWVRVSPSNAVDLRWAVRLAPANAAVTSSPQKRTSALPAIHLPTNMIENLRATPGQSPPITYMRRFPFSEPTQSPPLVRFDVCVARMKKVLLPLSLCLSLSFLWSQRFVCQRNRLCLVLCDQKCMRCKYTVAISWCGIADHVSCKKPICCCEKDVTAILEGHVLVKWHGARFSIDRHWLVGRFFALGHWSRRRNSGR